MVDREMTDLILSHYNIKMHDYKTLIISYSRRSNRIFWCQPFYQLDKQVFVTQCYI
jgi:hypothetical protein